MLTARQILAADNVGTLHAYAYHGEIHLMIDRQQELVLMKVPRPQVNIGTTNSVKIVVAGKTVVAIDTSCKKEARGVAAVLRRMFLHPTVDPVIVPPGQPVAPGSSDFPLPAQDITDAELSIMNLLWDRGRCTSLEIAKSLYSEDVTARLSIVQTLLERLEQKGYVTKDRTVRPRCHESKVSRKQFISKRLSATADALCSGSYAPLLEYLIRANFTPDRLSEFRKLLDELETNSSAC